MSTPKSVVKYNKDGIKFVSNVEVCKFTIMELTRAALRDVAKFVKREFRRRYYAHFRRHTGKGGNSPSYVVYANAHTLKPRLQIGLQHSYRGRTMEGFYGFFQEFGTSKQPKLGFLRKSAEENISKIVQIESQYLSGLRDEAEALRLIDEKEYSGGGDD